MRKLALCIAAVAGFLFSISATEPATWTPANIPNLSYWTADDLGAAGSNPTSWVSHGVAYTLTNTGSPTVSASTAPGFYSYIPGHKSLTFAASGQAMTNSSIPQIYAMWAVVSSNDYGGTPQDDVMGQDKTQGTDWATALTFQCCGGGNSAATWNGSAGDTYSGVYITRPLSSKFVLFGAWASVAGGTMTSHTRFNGADMGSTSFAWAAPAITNTAIGSGYHAHALAQGSNASIALAVIMTRTPTADEISRIEAWIAQQYFPVNNYKYLWYGFPNQNAYSSPSGGAVTTLAIQGSNDGTNWTDLATSTDANSLRDTTIIPWKNGWVNASTGGNGGNIQIRTSKYGGMWGPATIVNFCTSGTGTTQWAPEAIVSPVDNLLHMALACSASGSVLNFSLQDISTADPAAQTWNTPVAITWAAGSPPTACLIDPFRFYENGTWYMIYVNEQGCTGYSGYIEYATSSSINGPYTPVGTGDWAGWGIGLEGPAIFRLDNGHWRMLLDSSPGGSVSGGTTTKHYYYSDSSRTTFAGSTWTAPASINTTAYSLPGQTVGSGFLEHGTVIRVPVVSPVR